MARPSKLTESELAKIRDRHIAGESIRSLAKEVKMSESALRERISAQSAQIKQVAKQMVEAERNFKALPLSAQISARTLADEIKFRDENMASSAAYLSLTTKLWSKAAQDSTVKIMFKSMDDDGETVNPERLAACADEMPVIMKSIQLAKEASHIPLKAMDISAKEEKPEQEEGRKIILVNAPDE